MKKSEYIKKLIEEAIEEIMEEDGLSIEDVIEESLASKEAAARGLYRRGFGRYSLTPGGTIVYKTVDGKLVPANYKKNKIYKKKKIQKPVVQTQKKLVKKTEPQKKLDKRGISDIVRIKGDKLMYSFKFNGKPGKIIITDKDRAKGWSVSKIISDRIKKKILKRKQKMQALKMKSDSSKSEKPVIIKKTI